ncbi:hypothetical protein [Streptomyces sp. NRRL F-2580]|uniref:hypothetical protein n=1 Tax=Streptomyces sp. NRRL F-2580 TaxID=1463841 RepID=UPI00131B8F11|nr:hypothetical protein [Streptomyces sp. NRRL F-2580]
MTDQQTDLCRNCGEPVVKSGDRWSHGRHGFGYDFGGWGHVGCSAYSFTLRGEWDTRLTKAEKAGPRTRGQLAGREEFPAWPGLQRQRAEAERKEKEAAALAATRFSPQLAKAIEAAEAVVADPGSVTFRTLERRRQAVILAMEQQARRAAAKQGHAEAGSVTAENELRRLVQLTQELLRSLRAAEELLVPAEAFKAAAARYSARIDQIATERYASLPRDGDGAYTERVVLQTARRRAGRR